MALTKEQVPIDIDERADEEPANRPKGGGMVGGVPLNPGLDLSLCAVPETKTETMLRARISPTLSLVRP
jgi:hypothetical protein